MMDECVIEFQVDDDGETRKGFVKVTVPDGNDLASNALSIASVILLALLGERENNA